MIHVNTVVPNGDGNNMNHKTWKIKHFHCVDHNENQRMHMLFLIREAYAILLVWLVRHEENVLVVL